MILINIINYKIVLTKHTFVRADEREIDLDKIYATIKGGTVKRLGKHTLQFTKQYKTYTIVCIGQIRADSIIILTVETK